MDTADNGIIPGKDSSPFDKKIKNDLIKSGKKIANKGLQKKAHNPIVKGESDDQPDLKEVGSIED